MHRPLKLITSAAAASALLAVPALATPASAEPGDAATFFVNGDQAAFQAELSARGLQVDASEDFMDAKRQKGFLGLPSGVPTGPMNDPLDTNTSNQFFKPGQIPASLRFQSNQDNPGTAGVNPVGLFGLAISRPGSAGNHGSPATISTPVTGSENDSTTSADILAVNAQHEAYALDISLVEFSFVQPGTDPIAGPLEVRVFDEAGNPIGTSVIDQEEIGPFFGVLAPEGTEIGRINISDSTGGSELIHSVVAYDQDGGGATPAKKDPLKALLGGLGL